jgi:hypothetical protein
MNTVVVTMNMVVVMMVVVVVVMGSSLPQQRVWDSPYPLGPVNVQPNTVVYTYYDGEFTSSQVVTLQTLQGLSARTGVLNLFRLIGDSEAEVLAQRFNERYQIPSSNKLVGQVCL